MTVALLVLCQAALSYAPPLHLIHVHRVPYEVVKDNMNNMALALVATMRHIQRHGIEDYLIVLGDSIGYSGPGGAEQSVSRFLGDLASQAGNMTVFNFSIPGAQMGDIYTLLLMLREHGLEPRHVIVNLIYSGFVAREPGPPAVFWLGKELVRLDPETALLTGTRVSDGATGGESSGNRLEMWIEEQILNRIAVYAYRDYLRLAWLNRLGVPPVEAGDARPWYEKPWLESYLRHPEYARSYDPRPLVLDESNPDVVFLRQISAVAAAMSSSVLFFSSPVNQALLRDLQDDAGYRRNVQRISNHMEALSVEFSGVEHIDLTRAVPDDLFCDHLHLTADGYKRLAGLLWDEILLHGRSDSQAPRNLAH